MMVASDEELLRCSICKENFDAGTRKPKLLLCHHTFCLRCLAQRAAPMRGKGGGGRGVTCPTCHKVTSISKKGVTALQDNFYLEPHLRQSNEEVFQSDDEDDEPVPSSSNIIAKIWCETCLKVADASCTASHEICNYEAGLKRLEKRLETGVEQTSQALTEECSLLETYLELLQKAQGVIGRLNECMNSVNLSLATTRSNQDSLLQTENVSNSAELLEAVHSAEKLLREAHSRTKPLSARMTLVTALQHSTINVQCEAVASKEPLSFSFKIDDLKNDDEGAIIYLLCEIILNKNKGINAKKINSIAAAKVQDTSWHQVDRGRKVKSDKPSSTAYMYNIAPARSRDGSVGTSDPQMPSLNQAGSSEGSMESLRSGVYKNVGKIKPGLSFKNRIQCYFNIAVNGKHIGRVVFLLRPDVAPKMCANFRALCLGSEGFGYKGSKIFKGHPNDHIVGGDFQNNDGTGGHSIYNNRGLFLADDSGLRDEVGAVRMRGMGTDDETGCGQVGSQFHVWVGDREFRPYRRTLVIGIVIEGLDVLKQVSQFRTIKNSSGNYLFYDDIVIQTCGDLRG